MKTSQQSKIDRFKVGPVAIVNRPANNSAEHPSVFATRHLNNLAVIAGTCVGKTSQVTYATGWTAFLEYCTLSSIDPSLKIMPAYLMNVNLPLPLPVTVIGSFMSWLSVDKGVSPTTVSQYTSHVSDGFRRQLGVDCEFFKHPVIAQVRQSLRIAGAIKDTQTANDCKRLPMTIEMLEVMRKTIVNPSNLVDRASYLACIMAITMILRRSHLVMTPADHFIRSKDVTFTFYNPLTKLTWECTATDAAKYSPKHLTAVAVWIRSSKVDVLGKDGYMISYKVQTLSPTCAFCVATLMFEWAREAQPLANNLFLSYNGNVGEPWFLNYESYRGIIKRTARACGFDPKWFDTHSNRIGGATIMAADGHPDHSIKRAGGWSSLCFLDYVHWTQKSWDSVLCSLANPKLFTNDQMKRLNPSAVFVSV